MNTQKLDTKTPHGYRSVRDCVAATAALCEANKYTIVLAHGRNEDIGHDERAGYWEVPVDPKRMVVGVASFAEASDVFRAWIERNGLGGGNMVRESGHIKDADGRVVAEVSYNGRVWEAGQVGKKEVAL